MHQDVCKMSATDLVTEYGGGRLSPVDVTEAVLGRIERLNGTYNAFCVVDPDQALAQARASEARWAKGEPAGLVDGVPISVKDLILAKGWPTLRGSRTIDPQQAWDEDGPPVARMREHGAIILGKTTTPEFGWKGVTDSPLTGVTVNPWDPALTPGGSSGGAAAAAALGLGALHIATDGGGSIRMPAAFCGLFGLKPTFGVVPTHPHSPAGTLWHQGPIVRTVGDAALMLTVISEPDRRDWFSVPRTVTDFGTDLESGVDGLHIAYSRNLGYADVDADVAALVDDAAAWFDRAGAVVEEADPGFTDPIDVMVTLWSVALALAIEPLTADQREMVDPPVLDIAESGFAASAVSYRQAERARDALGRHMQLFHADYDLLITPQLPITAFAAGREVPEGRAMTRWWEWSPFTYPFNLTQQPAASLPCGFTAAGLPAALQVVGARFADAMVLRACRAYEAEHPFVMPESVD
jgi:aspartyl-tRNA(Asn)/glutamyl-tRNA(Gln) amidotransferase subunit A